MHHLLIPCIIPTISSRGRARETEAVGMEGGTREGGSTSQQRHASRVRMSTWLNQIFPNNVKSKRLNHKHFANLAVVKYLFHKCKIKRAFH